MATTRVSRSIIELVGDPTSFLTAADRVTAANLGLNKSFQDLGREARDVNAALGDVFGRGLESRAKASVAAIQHVGGATKLTDAEARKHLGTLDAWIAKSSALGREVPADILKTRDALRQTAGDVGATSGSVVGSLRGIAAAAGVAFSVGAATSWVSSTLEAAGTVDDLSKKVGVSAEAVQRWQFAAEQGGATIETVDRAVTFMNRTLADGKQSTVAALTSAGLRFDEIRRMRPEDAFDAITRAVQGIEDPMTRAQVAVALFGRSGADLLPAIVDGFADAAASASVMSDATVKRLADAEDAWGRLGTQATIVSGEVLAGAMRQIDAATSSWSNFFKSLSPNGAVDLAIQAEVDASRPQAPKAPPLPKGAGPAAVGFDVNQYLKDQEKALKGATSAAAAHEDAIRRLAESYKGLDKIRAAKDHVEALTKAYGSSFDVSKLTLDQQKQLNRVIGEAIDAYTRQGRVAPEAMRLVWLATLQAADGVKILKLNLDELGRAVDVTKLDDVAEHLERIGRFGRDAAVGVDGLLNKLPKVDVGIFTRQVEEAEEAQRRAEQATQDWISALGGIAGLMRDIAGTSESSWANVVRDIATVVDAYGRASQAAIDYQNAANMGGRIAAVAQGAAAVWQATGVKNRGAAIGGGAATGAQVGTMIMPGWGTLVGAGIGAAVGYIRSRGQGREMVEEFAEMQGGFDALHERLLALGDEGERLWVRLTQGVGNSNPEQAVAAINAVTSALGEHEAMLQRAADAAERYGLTFDQLGAEEKARRISEQAQGLLDDFVALTNVFDVSRADALTAMADEINGLIDLAAHAGVEIPPAMQKLVNEFIGLGLRVTETTKKLQEELDALRTERDSLVESIADEAPEEVMGVIEAETRARIAQIEAEMAAKQKEMDAAADQASEAADLAMEAAKDRATEIDQHIRDLFSRPMRIPIVFDVDDVPTPAGGHASTAATGGAVTPHGVQHLAAGGLVRSIFGGPRGTDTVPAWLTPGEGILTRQAMSLLGADALAALNRGVALPAASGSKTNAVTIPGQTINRFSVTINGNVDSEDRARDLVRDFSKEIRKGGRSRTLALDALGLTPATAGGL